MDHPIVRRCRSCGKLNRVPADHLADEGTCGACKNRLPPLDEPLEVDAPLFSEIVQKARVPVLVDFWAEWCGPCRMAAPEVAALAREMAGRAVVIKVNTEAHPDVAAQYRVQSIPNFAVLYNGRLQSQQAGVAPRSEMRKWLELAGKPAA